MARDVIAAATIEGMVAKAGATVARLFGLVAAALGVRVLVKLKLRVAASFHSRVLIDRSLLA